MKRLIDVDICIEKIKNLPITYDAETVQRCIEVLSNAPTVEAVPQWIPVSERLPDRIGRYLVYSTTIPMWEHFILNYDPEYKQWFWDGFRSEDCDINVLAWMPLPRHYEVNHEQTD